MISSVTSHEHVNDWRKNDHETMTTNDQTKTELNQQTVDFCSKKLSQQRKTVYCCCLRLRQQQHKKEQQFTHTGTAHGGGTQYNCVVVP